MFSKDTPGRFCSGAGTRVRTAVGASGGSKFLGMGLVCLAATACFKHSYTVGAGGDLNADPKYDSWESHWFFGIIGEAEIDVKEVCPSGNATVKDKVSFLNGLVGVLIGIVWYPTTVEVYCGAGERAASLTLSPEQMRRIALRPETIKWAESVSELKAAELQTAVQTYLEAHRDVASSGASSTF